MTYTATKYSIFAGNNELVILQGINREETVKKIIEDCPEFSLEFGLTENYRPKLRSNSFFSNQKQF